VLGTVAFTQVSSAPHDALLGVSLFVRGVGLGLIGISVLTAAYRDLPTGAIPRATGLISVVQRLGASSGTAVITVVLAVLLTSVPASGGPVEVAAAYGGAFWWTLGLMLVSFVPAFMLPGKKERPVSID